MKECVALGLRCIDGIDLRRFVQLSGGIPLKEFLNKDHLQECLEAGYVRLTDRVLQATSKGLPILDSVILQLLP